MRSFLKGTAIALALAGTVLVTGAASADNYSHNDRNRGASVLAIAFSDIAFGFRDGYWDNGHRWHKWRHSGDYRSYQGQSGSNYHDWNHNRDADHGWQRR